MARQVRVEYVDTVNEFGDAMRVRMTREQKWVVDFVAQYKALIEEDFHPVIRHDGSHGVPRRDLLNWSGETIEKRWATADTSMNYALTEAIRGIRSNWEYYRDEFLRRKP